jgi:hypothetical protein
VPPRPDAFGALVGYIGETLVEIGFALLDEQHSRATFTLSASFGPNARASMEAARLLHAWCTHERLTFRSSELYPEGIGGRCEVNERFPSQKTIAALKRADIVVACLDQFDAREAVNAFCRRYLIPLVDIGMSITSAGERLAKVDGQVIVSLPGEPYLRCFFLTDALLESERRHRPPGYDENPDAAGDPQVVSMNGVLASEACNCVLDLVTGYSGGRRGARQWQYDGRSGELVPSELPSRRARCPACAQEGQGDPPTALKR